MTPSKLIPDPTQQEDLDSQMGFDKERHLQYLAQLASGGGPVTPEQQAEISEKFGILIEDILRWASQNQMTVGEINRLGGGFINPVLLITTDEGRSFVAKGFSDKGMHERTKYGQKRLKSIFSEDEKILPKSEIYNDVLFSEKAEGEPIKNLLKKAKDSPEEVAIAKEGFRKMGFTLGLMHERTERVPSLSQSEEERKADEAIANVDKDKTINYLLDFDIAGLIDVDKSVIDSVIQRIDSMTEVEYISLIHADAHLDQFFCSGNTLVEIVDLDAIREGDPMADVGRALASLRDWCQKLEVPFDLEIEITKSLILGYEQARIESGLSVEGELDYMRVICYELRLRLTQTTAYKGLRSKLEALGFKGQKITQIDHKQAEELGLSADEQTQLSELVALQKEIKEIINYLKPSSANTEDQKPEDQEIVLIASQYHEDWQRKQLKNGVYQPVVETTTDKQWIERNKTDKADLANLTFDELPSDWQAENLAAATVVLRILKDTGLDIDLKDKNLRNRLGEIIHKEWLSRNKNDKNGELDKPFEELSQEEQEKDIRQLEIAIKVLKSKR